MNLAADGLPADYVPVGRPRNSHDEDRLSALLGANCKRTLFERTKTFLTNPALHGRLFFPFVESVLMRCKQDDLWPPDLILIAGTDNRAAGAADPPFARNVPLDPTDPLHWDTIHSAFLVEKRLKANPAWSEQIADCKFEVMSFGQDPHLYLQASMHIDAYLAGRDDVEQNLKAASSIVICQSPGLPMINAALLQMAIRRNRLAVRPVQVDQLDENLLLHGAPQPQRIHAAPEHFIRFQQLCAQWDDLMALDNFAGLLVLADQIPVFQRPGTETARQALLALLKDLDAMWALRPDGHSGPIQHYRVALNKLERCFERMGLLPGVQPGQPLESQVLNDAVYLTALIVERLKHLLVASLECIDLAAFHRPSAPVGKRISQGLRNFSQYRDWLPRHVDQLWRDLQQFDAFATLRNTLVHHLHVPPQEEFEEQIRRTAKLLGCDESGQTAGFILQSLHAMTGQLEAAMRDSVWAPRPSPQALPGTLRKKKQDAAGARNRLGKEMEA